VSENGAGEMNRERAYATLDKEALDGEAPGEPSPHSCPESGSVLREVEDGDLLRYRCRVGHAYTADGVLDGQDESVETALWTAIRAVQERAALSDRLAERVGRAGAEQSRERFEAAAEEGRGQAEAIRRILAGPDGAGG
jgi:two-component system, chemotaxis family, protein-glutamate methylesterase/glutaminase